MPSPPDAVMEPPRGADAARDAAMPVDERHPHGLPALPGSSAEARRFLRWMLAITVLLVVAVGALNTWVDPYGITGRGHYRTTSTSKARLLRVMEIRDMRAAPDIVILGSSTGRTLDPQAVHRLTGRSAYNLSVSAGDPLDWYAQSSYLAERFPRDFPHVVLGLDVESMRDIDPDPAIIRSAALWRQLSVRDKLRYGVPVIAPLFDLRAAQASVNDLREGQVARTVLRPSSEFRPDGRVKHDPLAGTNPAHKIPGRIRIYRERIYANDSYDALAGSAKDLVERTVVVANRHGDTPTIYLSPMLPVAQRALGPEGWYDRRRDVLAYLHGLQRHHHLNVVDLSDVSDIPNASVAGFHDPMHMDGPTADLLLAELERRGVLQ